jgi:hypothetical protein
VEESGEVQDTTELVARVSALAWASRMANPGWTFTPNSSSSVRMSDDERLEKALGSLAKVSAPTLRALIDEATRPDTPWADESLVSVGPLGANVADFVIRASFTPFHPDTPLPADAVEAALLDPLMFRDVLISYRGADPLASVRSALGLAPSASLAVDAVGEYGFDDVCLLLQVTSANYALQWALADASLDHLRGYAAADARGGAATEMHPMTAPFARFILKRRPSIDELVRMMMRGRFGPLGVSPSRFPPEAYRDQLSKLPGRPRGSGTWSGSAHRYGRFPSRKLPPPVAGWEQDSHMFLLPWRDTGRITAEAGAPVRIVGAPSHQHIVTRGRALRLRWQARILPVLIPAILLLFVVGADRLSGSDVMLDAQSLLRDPVLVAGTWAAPLLAGLLVGMGLASLSVFRERAFDELAAEQGSRHVIAEIRPERAFAHGLTSLRPDVFNARRPLPSTLTIATETNGLVVLGRGTRPERVAAIHWLNIVAVTPVPPSDDDVTFLGERRYRFAITVRDGDTTVSLPCTIVRAKLDWAAEATAWHRPFPHFVSRLDNGITGWMLARPPGPDDAVARYRMAGRQSSFVGTPFEAEVIEYERVAQEPAESPSRVRYRGRLRTNIPLMLVIAAFGTFGPSALVAMLG